MGIEQTFKRGRMSKRGESNVMTNETSLSTMCKSL